MLSEVSILEILIFNLESSQGVAVCNVTIVEAMFR